MPGRLTVHLPHLAQTADDLKSLADTLEKHLAEVDRGVHRVASTWTGEAQEAFQERYRQWRSASADLHRALRTLQGIVSTAHGNYSAARAANLRMWGGA
jgi:WXG100 family type VII secretion target